VTGSTINTRTDLISYLEAALALEHATIPVYLTAYYSIRSTTNSDAAHIIRVTAVEEMLHLCLLAYEQYQYHLVHQQMVAEGFWKPSRRSTPWTRWTQWTTTLSPK